MRIKVDILFHTSNNETKNFYMNANGKLCIVRRIISFYTTLDFKMNYLYFVFARS